MDQQHQGYESFNDFGFVNAFASGSENFTMSQTSNEINSKALNDLGLPALINQDYDSRTIENSSLYGLSAAPSAQYSGLQYHEMSHTPPSASGMSGMEAKVPNIPSTNQNNEQSVITNAGSAAAFEKSTNAVENNQAVSQPGPSKASETVAFDSSQNFMMKALGVVRKDALGASGTCKKRRRIVLLNDDDDSDDASELKKELLNKSSELDETAKKKNDSESEGSEADNESDHEETENLTDLGALKAKFLLKNAVIIQDPDKKKKKSSRLLDSDDDDQLQTTSVDDIGLLNENEEEEESFENDILIAEPIIPIENPILPNQAEVADENHEKKVDVKEEKIKDKLVIEESKVDNQNETQKKDDPEKEEKLAKIPANESKISPTDNEDHEIDPSIDPSMSVEAILENIKPMADDDEFFKFDKSDEENKKDKSLSNEEYFGSPDKSLAAGKPPGKKRGPKPGSKRNTQDPSLRQKRGDRYEDDFVDDSESASGSSDSDFTDSSSATSESSVEEVRPRGRPPLKPGRPLLMKKPPVFVPMKPFTHVPMRRKMKRDRFYDRSRDIPNEVYFGDVNVPLHILHTKWGTDDDSDDDEGDFRTKMSSPNFKFNNPSSQFSMSYYANRHIPSTSSASHHIRPNPYTYIHDHNEEPKLSTLREFVHLCGIKVNYQKLFDNVNSTDHKCMLLRRILAQKGMQGEPTVAKCKEIRRELQAKRESAELDKSVIINAEGRTRRSVRNATKVSYAEEPEFERRSIVQPETLQTLSKIRNVIDSDSE